MNFFSFHANVDIVVSPVESRLPVIHKLHLAPDTFYDRLTTARFSIFFPALDCQSESGKKFSTKFCKKKKIPPRKNRLKIYPTYVAYVSRVSHPPLIPLSLSARGQRHSARMDFHPGFTCFTLIEKLGTPYW